VQHFCPECNRNYDCQVELTKEYSTLKPHGLRCLTPFEWRCPECARKDVLLHGKDDFHPLRLRLHDACRMTPVV
jgi:hypothetical protein